MSSPSNSDRNPDSFDGIQDDSGRPHPGGIDPTLRESRASGSDAGQDFTGMGSWRIRGKLGAGGEAELFVVGRERGEVAILKAYVFEDREAKRQPVMPDPEVLDAIRDLDCPELVRILEHGIAAEGGCLAGRYCEVMEECEGQIQAQHWDGEEELLALVGQVAKALKALHSRRIAHRDVKPANILIGGTTERVYKLGDYGIATFANRRSRLGRRDSSPMYASPAQLSGLVSTTDDWWSLGLIVQESLLGRHPHAGKSPEEIQRSYVTQEFRPQVPRAVSDRWKPLLEGLLDYDPEKRWSHEQVLRWCEQGFAEPSLQSAPVPAQVATIAAPAPVPVLVPVLVPAPVRSSVAPALELRPAAAVARPEPTTASARGKHRGWLLIPMGFLGFGCLPFGLIAWWMARSDLRQIDEGTLDPAGRRPTEWGRNLGLAGSVFFVAMMIIGLFADPNRGKVVKETKTISPAASNQSKLAESQQPTGKLGVVPTPALAVVPNPVKPAPEPSKPGRVVITSSPPGAKVTIDGTDVGVTPWGPQEFPAKSIKVSLSLKAFEDQEAHLEVPSDGLARTNVVFPQGQFVFNSIPREAHVFVGAEDLGVCPVDSAILPAGQLVTARFVLKDEHFQFDDVVVKETVRAGGKRTLTGQFRRAGVVFRSTPSAATVLVDGRKLGVTPFELANIPPGSHAVIMTLEGFKTYSVESVLADGDKVILDAVLRPNPPEPAVAVAEESKSPTPLKRAPQIEGNAGKNSGREREQVSSTQIETAVPSANPGAQVFGAIAEAIANASTQTAERGNDAAKNDVGAALGASLFGSIAKIAADSAKAAGEAESIGSVDAKVARLPQIKAIQLNLDLDQVDSSGRAQFDSIASRLDVAAKSLQALERQHSTTVASKYLKMQMDLLQQAAVFYRESAKPVGGRTREALEKFQKIQRQLDDFRKASTAR